MPTIFSPDREEAEVLEAVVSIAADAEEKSTVIVHCELRGALYGGARIWPSTYLIEEDGIRRQLLHAFNIGHYPHYMLVNQEPYVFTLIFEGLSKSCGVFSLLEDIPQEGGFYTESILRNNTDVYRVEVLG